MLKDTSFILSELTLKFARMAIDDFDLDERCVPGSSALVRVVAISSRDDPVT